MNDLNKRIHIFGASGSGTTTLGRELSVQTNMRHLDTDDFFWEPSTPPFQKVRPTEKRQCLLKQHLNISNNWILSGSLCGWGDFTIPMIDLAIFTWLPSEIRMERLKKREVERYGPMITSTQHPNHEGHCKFMDWASRYDTAGAEMRSKALHEKWISGLPCNVITISSENSVATNIKTILRYLQN